MILINKSAIFSFNKDSLDLKVEIVDEFDQSTVLEFTKSKKYIYKPRNLQN